MSDDTNRTDGETGSLHQYALEQVRNSRSRGRAHRAAPYTGRLLDLLLEDFRQGRSSYQLARRGVMASREERRQSPLLRSLHVMALQRLEALRREQLLAEGEAEDGDDDVDGIIPPLSALGEFLRTHRSERGSLTGDCHAT
jgi:hypothetical protein